MTRPPPVDLEAVEARCEGATPESEWSIGWDSRPYQRDGYPWATFAIGPHHGIPKDASQGEAKARYAAAAGWRNADVALIRGARTDIPALIADLRATRQERDARCPPGCLSHTSGAYETLCNGLRERVAELEAVLLSLSVDLRQRAGPAPDPDGRAATLEEAAEAGARSMLHLVAAHVGRVVDLALPTTLTTSES